MAAVAALERREDMSLELVVGIVSNLVKSVCPTAQEAVNERG
jgi:hypothetical protein